MIFFGFLCINSQLDNKCIKYFFNLLLVHYCLKALNWSLVNLFDMDLHKFLMLQLIITTLSVRNLFYLFFVAKTKGFLIILLYHLVNCVLMITNLSYFLEVVTPPVFIIKNTRLIEVQEIINKDGNSEAWKDKCTRQKYLIIKFVLDVLQLQLIRI